ncbi:hypothetical protein H4S08_000923 [Coemansia sp. RSA 1365]|nr:hypothetical protein H4S08_000923 [Coemansia sp. RSA 1365]
MSYRPEFSRDMPPPAHYGSYGGDSSAPHGGGSMGMPPGGHAPPYAAPPMRYGPPPAKMRKIRHPNRPPCTTASKTLYIRNLNEKTKLPRLNKALRAIFETYGPIVEIRTRHSIRMRGQAFLTFEEQDDAVKAHGEVQGFVLFGKPMFIEFSRMPAEATIAKEGGDVNAFKEQRVEERERRLKEAEDMRARMELAAVAAAEAQAEVPNKILFLQGLPPGIEAAEIESTFAMHAGFVEVRWVSVKPDVAFVEFESDMHAGTAKAALRSEWTARPDEPPASISFAKR